MSYTKSISIIIPNYNGQTLLEKYLPYTYRAIENSGADFEIIVVDDASQDSSLNFISKYYPNIILLANKENCGFSFTCNQGIQMAQHDLVLLLNSDVKLEENYFAKLWPYFDLQDTFGVMGRIINPAGKIEDAARMMAFQGLKFKATHFYINKDISQKTPTAYLSGANALVDRKKLIELGGFDEIYSPFYVEDVDLSFRAWRLGWKCYYEHEAICHHEVSSTTKKEHSKKTLYPVLYRNKFILQAVHLDGIKLFLWKIQLLTIEVFIRALLGKWWIIKAYFSYLKKKPDIHFSRKKIKDLMKKHQGYKGLFDIRKNVFDSLKSGKIERLKA
ncbi:glycosyltransferase family 2 protein [Echinicola marina]|uniref:glycosyltransferase family 2 protein n=1 Tax=Echinicola marina TaxID=2859768 RepID=UPI001CF671C3|nr:glycosyltransferase family 2 protein [Echinicola marina]UCS91824.1 glycosyltransferase family 2 protein [Echinicola marina]